MTVDNIRDRPDHPRTNDTDIITENFVNYYGELYSHKKIDKRPLKRMIGNLDLDLSVEQVDSLNDPISDAEVNFSARFSTVQKKEKILKIQKAFFIAWKFIFSLFLLAK